MPERPHGLPSPRSWRTLDLFSGCGGMSFGLSLCAGPDGSTYRCVGAMDNWKAACDTFEANLGLKADCDGVSAHSVGRVLDRVGTVDVLTGGPPCQGFSTSGKRALDDPRNLLVRAYLEAIRLAAPRAFIMENVTGFTTFQDGRLMVDVLDRARSLGYEISAGIVLASVHGVPQRRRRFLMVGVKSGKFHFPGGGCVDPGQIDGTAGLEVDQKQSCERDPLTFDDATSDLPEIRAGQRLEEYASPPTNDFQRWAREGSCSAMDHVAVRHGADFVRMMSFVPEGRSAMDEEVRARIPEAIRPTSGFPNSYARIRGDQPAPTITRNFTTPSSANCIHPRADRALSIREGARCQSFPDRFRFTGSLSDRRLMIGNAVPPLLAKSIGDALLRELSVGAICDTGASSAVGITTVVGKRRPRSQRQLA